MGLITGLLTGVLSIVGSLTQDLTNGASLLGTLNAPTFPKFLSNNPLPSGYPWGSMNVVNTNYYTQSPNTGVVRSYTFDVAALQLAPDGVKKDMIVVNGAFPGPTIEANWGDTIQVTVNNNLDDEPVAIHWHGFLQTRQGWEDGIPGVTQCPIPPGKSFTYNFKAELYGTSWWHAHVSAQYSAGVFGPMVIHGPTNAAYDIDLGPVLLNDWYHGDYRSLVEEIMSPADSPVILTSDSNMINGKTNYPCSSDLGDECTENAGISKFRFQTGKTHRLRLINGGGDGYQQFSIDGHEMTVIANDFVTVNPYTTNVVTLGVGQRTDVLVKATMNPTSAVYMRSNITCVQASNPAAVAIIYYDKASNETIPESNPQSYTEGCSNDDLSTTVPTYPIPVPDPDLTVTVSITFGQNATGSWLWSMNNTSARTDYNAPTLLLAKQGNTSFEPDWNVYSTQRSKSYRFIVNNNSSTPHPLHYHGHNMYILATGTGTWDGSSITNPSNPQRRDVQIIPANGYLVWQADAINPGLWAFHCHIVWHLSAGFAMQVLENLDAIETLPVPSTAYQVCRDWAAWSGTNLVDQIDSGL